MTAHELGKELLAGNDLPVVNADGAEIDSVEEEDGEIILFCEDDEDDEPESEPETED